MRREREEGVGDSVVGKTKEIETDRKQGNAKVNVTMGTID